MDNSKNRHNNDHLGVNKIGKNIKKSPLHQPNFANSTTTTTINNPARQQHQPQVYNISKNDFRNIVQQLTGSPSHDPLPRPHPNPPKSQTRLQKIRPPPLPFNRPHIPPQAPVPAPQPPPSLPPNNFPRPSQFGMQPLPHAPVPLVAGPGDPYLPNLTESPVSAYMRYLQTSLMDPSPVRNQPMPPPPPQVLGSMPAHHPLQQLPVSSGMLPNNPLPALPSLRFNGPPMPPNTNLTSPHMNVPAPLPSPTSQFLLPSPSSYLNLLSPRSPYPLLSPGVQFPPLTPNFSFSPIAQSGILGPGPQPLPSPGHMFPLSPSGFFAMQSPRWKDQ